jgi:hypothetical protein
MAEDVISRRDRLSTEEAAAAARLAEIQSEQSDVKETVEYLAIRRALRLLLLGLPEDFIIPADGREGAFKYRESSEEGSPSTVEIKMFKLRDDDEDPYPDEIETEEGVLKRDGRYEYTDAAEIERKCVLPAITYVAETTNRDIQDEEERPELEKSHPPLEADGNGDIVLGTVHKMAEEITRELFSDTAEAAFSQELRSGNTLSIQVNEDAMLQVNWSDANTGLFGPKKMKQKGKADLGTIKIGETDEVRTAIHIKISPAAFRRRIKEVLTAAREAREKENKPKYTAQ